MNRRPPHAFSKPTPTSKPHGTASTATLRAQLTSCRNAVSMSTIERFSLNEHLLGFLSFILLISVLGFSGDDFRVTAFSLNGDMTLTNAFTNGVVTIEQAATVEGPWTPEKNLFSTHSPRFIADSKWAQRTPFLSAGSGSFRSRWVYQFGSIVWDADDCGWIRSDPVHLVQQLAARV